MAGAAAAPAQSPPGPWRRSSFAYPFYSDVEGLDLNATVGYHRTVPDGRLATAGAVDVALRYTGAGTRIVSLAAAAPGLRRGWRLLAVVSGERYARFPYYGLGNASVRSTALEDSLGPEYYKYDLWRATAFVAAQREVTSWLRIHVAAQGRHYRARALGRPTQLAADLAGGLAPDTGGSDGVELRAGVVADTRDFEPAPRRGVRVEAVLGRSVAAPFGAAYTRGLLSAAGYLPLGAAVVALRGWVEVATHGIPVPVMAERLTSWGPEDHVGGFATVRASWTGRWLAPDRAVMNAEVRMPLQLHLPTRRGADTLWVAPFADLARLWGAGGGFALSDLHGGVGVAVSLQTSRAARTTLSVAHSADAPLRILAGAGFAF